MVASEKTRRSSKKKNVVVGREGQSDRGFLIGEESLLELVDNGQESPVEYKPANVDAFVAVDSRKYVCVRRLVESRV